MLKTSVSQLHTTVNKRDNCRNIDGSGADIDDFGRSIEKSSKYKKSTILGNSGAIEKLKFLTFGIKEVFNLLRQAFTKALIF